MRGRVEATQTAPKEQAHQGNYKDARKVNKVVSSRHAGLKGKNVAKTHEVDFIYLETE